MASIERDVTLDLPADEVWRAITDESLLREWFAPEVELDPRPGGDFRCTTGEGEDRAGTVKLVEEGERIVFGWQRDGAEPSRVELRITELEGGTRLTVTESGLAPQAAAPASEGWRTRLEGLRLAVARLAYA